MSSDDDNRIDEGDEEEDEETEDIPKPPPVQGRATSFARDFFAAGADSSSVLQSLAEMNDDDLLPDSVPVPKSRPIGRRSSARVLTQTSLTRMSSRTLLLQAQQQQQQQQQRSSSMSDLPLTGAPPPPPPMAGDIPTPTTLGSSGSGERKQILTTARSTTPSSMEEKHDEAHDEEDEDSAPPMTRPASRNPSWYNELLEQGHSPEDLAAFLGDSAADSHEGMTDSDEEGHGATPSSNKDDMLAEQYRFMALIEAKKIVLERLGYDPHERRQQRKPSPVTPNRDDDSIRPCPMPKLKPLRWTPSDFPYSVPPAQIPIYPQDFIRPTLSSQPELQRGEPVAATTATSSTSSTRKLTSATDPDDRDRMVVRCLGCKTNVSVRRPALLVQCGKCSVVSPASSTRK